MNFSLKLRKGRILKHIHIVSLIYLIYICRHLRNSCISFDVPGNRNKLCFSLSRESSSAAVLPAVSQVN